MVNPGSQDKTQSLHLANEAFCRTNFPNPVLAAPSLMYPHYRPFFILRMCNIYSFLPIESPLLGKLLFKLQQPTRISLPLTADSTLHHLHHISIFYEPLPSIIFILSLSILELLVYFLFSPERLGWVGEVLSSFFL